MLVTLICEDRLYGVLLPEKVRGQYWLEDKEKEIQHTGRRLLGIEAENGVWKIAAGKKIKLYNPGDTDPVPCLILEIGKMYMAQLSDGRRGYIFTEPYTQDRCTFRKYWMQKNMTVNIGSGDNNQIVIASPYISSIHAQLVFSGTDWVIHDCHSTNGIYIDERRVRQSAKLHPGDVLYMMGVKIVLGDRFLAINNPDGIVSFQPEILRKYKSAELAEYEPPDEIITPIYYRSPGFRREITPLELKIDQPTTPEKPDETPLALSLAPSLVMGVASFSSGLVTVSTTLSSGGSIVRAFPTLLMSISMLAGMVLFPFIIRSGDRKRKIEKEQERREKYLKYLGNIRNEIKKASDVQRDILNENFPPILSQIKENGFYDMILWNRVIGQKDFLTLRLGEGNVRLQENLKFPDQRFSIDDDIMRDEVNRLSEEKLMIAGVPVIFSLTEHRVAGIVGNSRAVVAILNNLLLQIAALHSYDEVKIIFLCEECDLEKYDYVRWMQHTWDNSFRKRYLATTPGEVRDLSVYFTRVMERYRGEKAQSCPHYVIISTSKALSDGCAFLNEFLGDPSVKGFSYLAVYDELKNLPKECTAVVQVNDTQSMLFDYQTPGGAKTVFVQDMVDTDAAARHVMDIAGYHLDLQSGKYALPGMLTFLEMYRVGKYEHLNITTRWKENNPVLSLRAPVGVNSDGDLFYLDLHENAHGPHGLVAGMTGSGKSEFIITYVLSLAMNYSPDDVAFILIDYKGGGLVGAFDNELYHLPHLAGTITNLDGAAINRSLLSIQSELRRRQVVFNEARRVSNEGTMDIYKYQKLYRNGVVKDPVPHLFIISDEFAELKTQQPEFMTQLISTARIGRSLGVHLILATQKPSGVVNDQIWANSKFKVCLKVQDRADSMDMLKRPDAAELVETGRFYLQVGYNELFELGQSAWCGAPYIPTDTLETELDERIQMIGHLGDVVEEAKPARKTADSGNARKQIVEIAQYIARIAEEEQLWAKPLWMPEIPAVITVEQLEEKYQYQVEELLNPVIGEVDDPFNQSQRLLTLPLSTLGNAICYGIAGSGKKTFCTALLYSLYRAHTSAEVNAYILDFGAETLRMFAKAPQTGDVIVSGEEEKTASLFRYLQREAVRRRKLFADLGGDYQSYRRAGRDDVPNIVVLINNYTNFAEQYELLDEQMVSLTRDCSKYGIYFVLTCIAPNGVRYRLKQNFPQVYVLQQNEKTDYTSLLGNTGGVYPSQIAGRGIYRDTEVYEFQTAYVTETPEQTADAMRTFCEGLKDSGQRQAKPVPMLPRLVQRGQLDDAAVSFGRIPLGLDTETLETVCLSMEKESTEQVLAMDLRDTAGFAEGIANLLQETPGFELYVFDPGKLISVDGIDAEHYVTEKPEEAVVRLFRLTVERHNACKQADGILPEEMDTHPVIAILVGLGRIKGLLTADGVDKLKLILEKTSGKFRLFFWAFDDYKSANAYNTEEWCRGDGIWVGNGLGDQIRLKVNGRVPAAAKTLDSTDGFQVRRGAARPIKLLVSDRMEVEEEEDE